MTVRADIEVDYELDPRLAIVGGGAPGDEVTVQDSHDTLTGIQDSIEGSEFTDIVSTAGGEELAGGVTVGLTQTLKNIQYAPDPTSPRSTGTATSTDGTGITLTDTGADFVADGVQRGDWVINFTDQSVTEVLTVATQSLVTRGLRDGTANTFTSSDAYKVWEVREFDLSGGNFVALDEFDVSISALFTTFGRFASKTSASSATDANSEDIRFSSYGGGVTLDVTTSNTGTIFPTGTPRQPVNNMTDALAIIAGVGLPGRIFVRGDLTLTTGDTVSGVTFDGDGQDLSTFTLDAAASVTDCTFTSALVTGTLDGGTRLQHTRIQSLSYFDGTVEESIIESGTITLGGTAFARFIHCESGVAGQSTPIIDMAGDGPTLEMRDYYGGIEIRNKTGADAVSIDLSSGQVVLDSATVTGVGDIVVRGVGKLVDENGDAIPSGTWNSTVPIVNELVEAAQLDRIESKTKLIPAAL